jgi:serine protease AprX
MAAALVSGVVASTLDAHPEMTPDQVKHALAAGARPVASDDRSLVGAGLVDAARTALSPPAGSANLGLGRSSGLGSLGASRGTLSMGLPDAAGTLLTGRQTAQLLLWDPVGFTTGSWTPSTWYTSAHGAVGWNTAGWLEQVGELTGISWTGKNWTGKNWTGKNWTGADWTGSSSYDVRDERSAYGRHGPGSASYGAWE